ncbi:MAG: hypothetical protein J2P37_18225, partial [Ktedonobacteraceae bacterium]|nr:hypothetical protein [Ktedonobacteraceae bacterium]
RPFASFTYCIAGFFIFTLLLSPPVLAAPAVGSASVTMSMPNGVPLLGHVGTALRLSGQGFTANSSVSLYLSADGHPDKCSAANQGSLLPFNTLTQVTADSSGTFQQDTKWPDNAANATTSYFLCAISSDMATMSSTPFTVAQEATVDSVTPQTVAPGGTITVKGSNWLPLQKLNVSVGVANSDAILATKSVNPSGQDGIFTAQLTVPADTQPGSYTVTVYAVNEQTQAMTKTASLTVQEAAPTPTVPPTATPEPSPTASALTPTPTPSTSGNGSGGLGTFLIFTLGGVGVVMVIVGITMVVIYSRRT